MNLTTSNLKGEKMRKTVFLTAFILLLGTFVFAGVDLAFTGKIVMRDLSLKPGKYFTAQYTCKSGKALNFRVYVKLDGRRVSAEIIERMEAGEVREIEYGTRDLGVGAHTIEFILDPEDSVDELNEDNNVESLKFKISEVYDCAKYQKEQTDLYVPKAYPIENSSGYDVYFNVRNTGLRCINNFRAHLKDSFGNVIKDKIFSAGISRSGGNFVLLGKKTERFKISIIKSDFPQVKNCEGLKKGSEQPEKAKGLLLKPSCSEIYIIVDPLNAIPETNEMNNRSGKIQIEW